MFSYIKDNFIFGVLQRQSDKNYINVDWKYQITTRNIKSNEEYKIQYSCA